MTFKKAKPKTLKQRAEAWAIKSSNTRCFKGVKIDYFQFDKLKPMLLKLIEKAYLAGYRARKRDEYECACCFKEERGEIK